METLNRLAVFKAGKVKIRAIMSESFFLSDRGVITLSKLIYEMFKHRSDRITV